MQLSHYCVGMAAVLSCATSILPYNQSDYLYYGEDYYEQDYYDDIDGVDDISQPKHDYYTQRGPCPTYGLTVSTADECERAAFLLKLKPEKIEAFPGHAYGCYWEPVTGIIYVCHALYLNMRAEKQVRMSMLNAILSPCLTFGLVEASCGLIRPCR